MKIKTLTLVDTAEFERWACEKYNMSNDEWNKKIWRSQKGLLYYMEDGSYSTYEKTEKPETLLEEHINDFLDEFPEFNGRVSLIFTN